MTHVEHLESVSSRCGTRASSSSKKMIQGGCVLAYSSYNLQVEQCKTETLILEVCCVVCSRLRSLRVTNLDRQ